MNAAQVTSPVDEGWVSNGAGFHFNHKFGFGRLDASRMVTLAKSWKNVPKQRKCQGPSSSSPQYVEYFLYAASLNSILNLITLLNLSFAINPFAFDYHLNCYLFHSTKYHAPSHFVQLRSSLLYPTPSALTVHQPPHLPLPYFYYLIIPSPILFYCIPLSPIKSNLIVSCSITLYSTHQCTLSFSLF